MSKTYIATTAEQLGAYPVGSLNGKDLNNEVTEFMLQKGIAQIFLLHRRPALFINMGDQTHLLLHKLL